MFKVFQILADEVFSTFSLISWIAYKYRSYKMKWNELRCAYCYQARSSIIWKHFVKALPVTILGLKYSIAAVGERNAQATAMNPFPFRLTSIVKLKW